MQSTARAATRDRNTSRRTHAWLLLFVFSAAVAAVATTASAAEEHTAATTAEHTAATKAEEADGTFTDRTHRWDDDTMRHEFESILVLGAGGETFAEGSLTRMRDDEIRSLVLGIGHETNSKKRRRHRRRSKKKSGGGGTSGSGCDRNTTICLDPALALAASGPTCCGNHCVDTMSSVQHCGTCNSPCDSGLQHKCIDGRCYKPL